LTTGAVIGPFVGGVLADQIGYRNIFFVTGAFGLVATVLVILLVQEPDRSEKEVRAPGLISNYRFVFTSAALVTIFVGSSIAQVAVMAIQPVLSLFVETLLPGTRHLATMAGGVFAITGLASLLAAPYWGKRGDRMGYKRVLAITLLGTGITCLPQALVTQVYQLFVLRFVHGLFVGGILPALYTLTTLNAPEERRGGILGITRSGLLIGNVLGPISGGFLAAAIGMRPLFLFTASLLIALPFCTARMIHEPTH
jgi:DHA1 family multidrug resistance protein-like MFS transporter